MAVGSPPPQPVPSSAAVTSHAAVAHLIAGHCAAGATTRQPRDPGRCFRPCRIPASVRSLLPRQVPVGGPPMSNRFLLGVSLALAALGVACGASNGGGG